MKTNNSLRIDIHGMYVEDALDKLHHCINNAPKNIEKIIVIHGYNNGTALKEAVHHKLHNPRILETTNNFGNEGESTIWLKKSLLSDKN